MTSINWNSPTESLPVCARRYSRWEKPFICMAIINTCEIHLSQTLRSTGSVLDSAFLPQRYGYLLQFPLLVLSELEVQRLAVLCNFQVYVLVRRATHFKQGVQKNKNISDSFPNEEERESAMRNSRPESEPLPAASAPPSPDPCCKATHVLWGERYVAMQCLTGRTHLLRRNWPTESSDSAHFQRFIAECVTDRMPAVTQHPPHTHTHTFQFFLSNKTQKLTTSLTINH